MAKKEKLNIEFLLVKAEVKGIPEKGLLRSRNIGQMDLIWPRTGVAKKSGAREMVFKKGECDFTGEPWTKRVVFREEIEDHCGLAVSITNPLGTVPLVPLGTVPIALALTLAGSRWLATLHAGWRFDTQAGNMVYFAKILPNQRL